MRSFGRKHHTLVFNMQYVACPTNGLASEVDIISRASESSTHGHSMSTIRVDTLSTGLSDKRIYSCCRQRYADDEPLPFRRTTCRFYFDRSLIVFARLLALAV